MLSLGLPIGDGLFFSAFEENVASHEASEQLVHVLFLVDGVIWFLASILSFYLARLTLEPVEEIYTLQEKFVGDVAHELRTPLTVIKAGAETMLRSERSVGEYKTFVSESLEEIERIITLTNDLLSLLQHKLVGTRDIVSVDFSAVVESYVSQIKAFARDKKITFTEHVKSDVFVRGAAHDLARLVMNILKNAVDYNKEGGVVTVALSQEEGMAVLTITDTGIGMTPDDVLHIFERFYKADSARVQTKSSGTGLGLSIVKEIIDAHDGSIEVTSTLGSGTTITVSLPCA